MERVGAFAWGMNVVAERRQFARHFQLGLARRRRALDKHLSKPLASFIYISRDVLYLPCETNVPSVRDGESRRHDAARQASVRWLRRAMIAASCWYPNHERTSIRQNGFNYRVPRGLLSALPSLLDFRVQAVEGGKHR